MVQLNKYKTHMDMWCKIKSIELDNNKYVFRVCIIIDERKREINNYNY